MLDSIQDNMISIPPPQMGNAKYKVNPLLFVNGQSLNSVHDRFHVQTFTKSAMSYFANKNGPGQKCVISKLS